MLEMILPPLVAALGFLLGFYFTRTMKVADNLPEKYMSKDDCGQIRSHCQHLRDVGREEILARFDRLETKVDRLSERLLG